MDTQNSTSRPSHYCLPGTTALVGYDLGWLLLTAPKDRRLDLALASIIHPWHMQLTETVQNGKKVLVPVWYFQHYPNDPRYHFTHTPYSTLPGISRLLSDPVPYYSQSEATNRYHGGNHLLHNWLTEKGVEYTLLYQKTLGVQLKYNAGKGVTLVKEPENVIHPAREVRMAVLLARAAVEMFAPDLVPYLESDAAFPVPDMEILARQEAKKPLYQVIFLPAMLGVHADPECMYQEWDARLDQFLICAALKRMNLSQEDEEEDEERERDAPSQCHCCGGYYCEHHFSGIQQEFVLTREEISWYGTLKAKLEICRNCALLEEPVRQAVRAAFLLANGEKPYAPDKPAEEKE